MVVRGVRGLNSGPRHKGWKTRAPTATNRAPRRTGIHRDPDQGEPAAALRGGRPIPPRVFVWLHMHGIGVRARCSSAICKSTWSGGWITSLPCQCLRTWLVASRSNGGVLPVGRWVTSLHVGRYDGLISANAWLQEWAHERGIRWQMPTARTRERHLTDPSREPDPSRWGVRRCGPNCGWSR